MKFSEYVVLSRPVAVMDPLGFLSPYAGLQDKLFRQFTVLSNHPSYHGLLCLVFQILADCGMTPAKRDFARAFRELEILWGMANVATGAAVLNVTKYRLLLESGEPVALAGIRRGHPVFQRLAYGALGHYSSPSSFWGILSKSGVGLTDLGNDLGTSYDVRASYSLRRAMQEWSRGARVAQDILEDIGKHFALAAPASREERAVWRRIITQYCEHMPHVAVLWEAPLQSAELESFHADATAYSGFFPAVRAKYTSLGAELLLMEQFELLAGIVQFIFEREYLCCQYGAGFQFPIGELEQQVAAELGALAAQYTGADGHADTKGLFQVLAQVASYSEAAEVIIQHHVRHQKSKGASPFLEDGELLIRDRYRMQDFRPAYEELRNTSDWVSRRALLAYRYRRDWHFGRACTYHEYAGPQS